MTELSLEGFRTRGRDSIVRQGVPFLDRSRIERAVVLHDGMRNACSLLFLEGRSFGISLLDASTRTLLFFSLYIISNLICFLRSSKVVHSSWSIMLLTDEVLWYRLVIYYIVHPFFEPSPIDGCHFVGMGPIQSWHIPG